MKRTNTHSDAFLSCIHTDGRIDWPRERGGERDKETRRQHLANQNLKTMLWEIWKKRNLLQDSFSGFRLFSLAGQAFMPEQANSYKR